MALPGPLAAVAKSSANARQNKGSTPSGLGGFTGKTTAQQTPQAVKSSGGGSWGGGSSSATASAAPAAVASNSVASGPSAQQVAAAQAAAAEAQRISQVQAQTDDQVRRSTSQADSSVGTAYNSYNASAQNLADQIRTGQNAINSARQNIAVGQINSIKGLVQTIQQGINSGRVSLGNKNALDSSAAVAMGRAFQQYGDTQRNTINNDAAIKQNDQDKAQTELDTQRAMGQRSLFATRDNSIQQIGNDLEQQLASIDASAASQGVTGRVNINAMKQQAVSNAQGRLASVDAWLQGQLSGTTAATSDQNAAEAYRLSNLGVSGTPFTYDTAALTTPTEQYGGADISQLPLYTKPKANS